MAYSSTVATTGGTAPLTFTVSAGSLPPGLSLNSSTGVISGSPTTPSGYNFTITATDVNGLNASRLYTVAIVASGSTIYYWDPSHLDSGTGSGGAGTWDTSTANWFNGTTDVAWTNATNAVAVFAGATAGTVTLNTGISANAIDLNGTGYIIQGNTLTLVGSNSGISVASGESDTIGSTVGGSVGLYLTGGGTLALTNSNTYTPGTTISAGTLLIGNATALGAGPVTLNDSNTATNNTALLATITGVNGGSPIANNITVANFGTGTSMLGTALFTPTGPVTATEFTGTISLQKNVTLQGGNTVDRTSYEGNITSSGSVTINVTSASGTGGSRTTFGPGLPVVNSFQGTINIIGTNTVLQVGAGLQGGTPIPASVSVNVGAALSSAWTRRRWLSTA